MKVSAFVVPMLASLLLLEACSEPSSTQILQDRITASMSPTQICNRPENVEYLSNGVRIRIPDTSLFTIGRTDLSDCGRYALARVVEAMLDPRIMQVVVEPGGDINAPEAFLPRERAATVRAFLSNVASTATQPPVLVQPAAGPSRNWGIVLMIADEGPATSTAMR